MLHVRSVPQNPSADATRITTSSDLAVRLAIGIEVKVRDNI